MQLDSFPVVVEHDPAYRQILQMAFQRAGFSVGKAHFLEDADRALDYLGAIANESGVRPTPIPTFMMLDLELPGHSGFDILAWTKAHAGLQAVPVIVLGLSDDPKAVSKAYAYGANSYLVKPSDSEELVRMITVLRTYWGAFNHCAQPIVRTRTSSVRDTPVVPLRQHPPTF